MTQEEAIIRFERQLKAAQAVLDSGFGSNPGENDRLYRERKEMAKIALASLRSPTREQVERIRSHWITVVEINGREYSKCAACQNGLDELEDAYSFCPRCGSPMTDEAVDIVMQRLEALYEHNA